MTVDGKGISKRVKGLLSRLGKNKYMILLLVLGVILIIYPSRKETEIAETPEAEPQFSVAEAEKKLEDILSSLDGAGRVKVMLSVKDEGRRIIARDSETSESGGDEKRSDKSEKTVIISSGSSREEAVTLGYIYPEYLGALVAAEGAESAKIRLDITESVSAVTGLSSDNIKVIKMK